MFRRSLKQWSSLASILKVENRRPHARVSPPRNRGDPETRGRKKTTGAMPPWLRCRGFPAVYRRLLRGGALTRNSARSLWLVVIVCKPPVGELVNLSAP